MQILAIIPARSGSKGIVRKNLQIIAGKSLLEWSILAAKGSSHNLRVVVSTDGEEIALEARRCGAEVVMRPKEISGDEASSESALLHVLDELENREGYLPELLVFLQCTSPLTTSEDIDGTIEAILRNQADSALTVVPFHYFIWQPTVGGDWIGVNHNKNIRQRRQERSPEYLESGSVYVFRVNEFRKKKHRFFGKTVAHKISTQHCLEIDEPSDLLRAAAIMTSKKMTKLLFRPAAVVFDFDGVMTDNAVYLNENGQESVRCDRGDGMGIELLRNAGISMLILSKEENPVVKERAKKLRIGVIQSENNKAAALQNWARNNEYPLDKIFYLGNDINDIECMKLVGCAIAVADAHPSVLKLANFVLSNPGGRGAVRELAERILAC